MSDKKPREEKSESGLPIYYHSEAKEFEFANGDDEIITAIEKHITQHIGVPDMVFHELISDKIHIDIHMINPTKDRDFYTLVTSGMSQKPMSVPDGAEDYKFAELMLCLPPSWEMDQEKWSNENHYFPIRLLKFLARLPHNYSTWLSYYHTIPNGNPPLPYATNTALCGAMIFVPVLFPQEFHKLELNKQKTVCFYNVIPLYESEMNLKLSEGSTALIERLEVARVTELLNVSRKNTV